MNKELLTIALAFGCIASNAASVNYDILGRKGSRMNTPMVYKNVNYSKTAKSSALAPQVLMKQGTGLSSNVKALAGRFNSVGWGQYNYCYFTETFYSNYSDPHSWTQLSARDGYLNPSNNAFITTSMKNVSSSAYTSRNETYSNYEINWGSMSTNRTRTSPYDANQQIIYKKLSDVRDNEGYSNKKSFNQWYGNIKSAEKSDVGLALITNALPAWMKKNDEINFFTESSSGAFKTTPGVEMDATNAYKIIKNTSNHSVVYLTTQQPENPELTKDRKTQIYIGLRTGKNANGGFTSQQVYGSAAAEIDNYIYDNRTIEIIPAGNHKSTMPAEKRFFTSKSHAANAITVGAIDPKTNKIAGYMPTKSPKYCPSTDKTACNNGRTANVGTSKPEVYNYSHLYIDEMKKTYISGAKQYSYEPYYDGTEAAAAYTAGMISDLLATNAFYRWHPEVVRALLITSSHASGKNIPTYETMISAKGSNNKVAHESRYWIGDFSKFEDSQYKKEIRFSIKTSDFKKKKFVAAISWLSRGDDILKLGKIPQDFTIYAYPSDDGDIHSPTPYAPTYPSPHVKTNNFEKITFTQTRDYMVFQIKFMEDESSADYKNQIVLGFDLAAYD